MRFSTVCRLAVAAALAQSLLASDQLLAQTGSGLSGYNPIETGFTVAWPSQPQLQKIKSPGFLDELYQYQALGDAGRVFLVQTLKLPITVVPGEQRQFLQNFMTGFANGAKAKLLTQREITLGQNPGVEFTAEIPFLGNMKGRIYLVNDRIYSVIVGWSNQDQQPDWSQEQFLNSFQITGLSGSSYRPVRLP